MPKTKLVFYQEDGVAPAVEWLSELRAKHERAFAKCRVRLQRLAELGHELRRPEADYLILFRFQDETNCATFLAWQDPEKSMAI